MSATATNTISNSPPSTMKAMQVHGFVSDFQTGGDLKKCMTMSEKVPLPKLKKNELLIKVLACSISPGDIIMVHGNLIFLHEAFPFVPGMDICGIVEDVNGATDVKKGDLVVAAKGMSPTGGMAEYMAIPKNEAVVKPPTVAVAEAAASSSAITARNAVLDHVKPGDRVLVLGGSGGVGSAAIQLCKHHAKASFVATTSTQTELCKKLGADQVINYRKENWWELAWETKFDKVIDCVGGGNFTDKAEKVLKPGKQGGVFVAVCGDDPKPDCRTVWKAVKFLASMPLRPLYTWLHSRRLAKYVALMPYDIPRGRKQVLNMMEEGSLRVLIDDRSPLAFTEEGVREAFRIVASGHAHGKVVVSMESSK